MNHKIRESLCKKPGTGSEAALRWILQSRGRRGSEVCGRKEEIIWFWSRGIVTAVRRVERCLRFAQISTKISPIVDGKYRKKNRTEKNRMGGRL